jgi:hypothetical protein
MKQTINIEIICQHYEIEPSFIRRLDDLGLIQLIDVNNGLCVEQQQINQIDKIMRLYHELEINPEGIDVVLNLLKRIKRLEQTLRSAENKLNRYESLIK